MSTAAIVELDVEIQRGIDDVRHLVNIVRVFYAKRDLDKLI